MEYLEIINKYGFPIFCVIMMGMLIYNFYNKVMEENKQREGKLYKMITDNQRQLKELSATNASFLEVLKNYSDDMNEIKDDINFIKDNIKKE